MRQKLVEHAAKMIGVDPEELTVARAMAIIKTISLNTGDFTVQKANKKDGKRNG